MADEEVGGDSLGAARSRVVLVGIPPEKAVDHLVALEGVGFEAVVADGLDDIRIPAEGVSVIVVPLAGGAVTAVVDRFPSVAVVALAPRLSAVAARQGIREGAVTVVGLDEPVGEAAETIFQASIGFCRLPVDLLQEAAADSVDLTVEEVAWLQLLGNDGLTMSDVAHRIGWSRAELYRRLRPLYRRLGAGSRREAVLRARQMGRLS